MTLTIRPTSALAGRLRLSIAGYVVTLSDMEHAEVRLSMDSEGASLEVIPLDTPVASDRTPEPAAPIQTPTAAMVLPAAPAPPRSRRPAAAPSPKTSSVPAPPAAHPEDPALFKKLVALRKQIAQELDRPAYMVFQDRCLKDMIACRPDNIQTLSAIPSIGASRAKRHGAQFLKLLASHPPATG
jgi:superfamily II DNA helicase RecQ